MATTTIPWGDGSGGNIYLTYPSASGDQNVEVSSDANTGSARSKTVTFTAGSITKELTVSQDAYVFTIPYIRNTDVSAYIDTGITPDQTTRVIVWARNLNPYAYAWLFGSRVSGTSNGFSVCAPNAADTGRIRLQFGNNGANTSDAFKYLGGYHKYELNGGVLYVDDVNVASVTNSTFSNTHNIHLFGLNNNGTHASASVVMDICAAKIYKGGNLVRDFTAVNSPSVGLYDSVSNTVFTNPGSGSFTYGTFNPNAYTPLEYITDTNNAAFNSGVYGTYSLPIVCKCMPTNTTPKWTTILGQRVSSPANSCDLSLGTATSGQDNMKLYWRFGASTANGQPFVGSTSNKLTNKAIVIVKSSATATVYYNNSQIGTNTRSGVSTSFTTTYPMAVGDRMTSSSSFSGEYFGGQFYYVCFGSNRCFMPAKVNGIAGMYDTYNDVFYKSETAYNFSAGPEL